jgi:hypothetical protein
MISIVFFSLNGDHFSVPHIRDEEPITYECDGKQGYITFDGSFNVDNFPYPSYDHLPEWERPQRYPRTLPIIMDMYVRNGICRTFDKYMIEVYKKVIHESTDKISEIEEEGETMRVCFTPTDRQTIYFTVLEHYLI